MKARGIRSLTRFVAVVYFLALALTLAACERVGIADVSEELKETIVDEAVGEMHPSIADAVNEAVEECEGEAQAAIEDFESCLMVQSDELLEDALLVCTPDPPSCDKW